MVSLFKDVVPSILQKKDNVFVDSYSEYDPYMTNKALSHHKDCLPYVNEMNRYYFLDKDIQYNFYLFSIRSMKRPFQQWHKMEEISDINNVKKYFKCSNKKAKEYLQILTKEQKEEISKVLDSVNWK